MADEQPPKGIRAVRARLVANAQTGMPEVQVDHDDMVRAAWSLAMEKFFPEPKPPTRWQRFKAWIRERLEK
jgi:hypothetical protein